MSEIIIGTEGAFALCRDLYALLSSILLDGPRAKGVVRFLGDFRRLESDLDETASPLIPSLSRLAKGAEPRGAGASDPLEAEYVRLFIGPGRAVVPPYASSYVGSAQGSVRNLGEAERVAAVYDGHGLRIASSYRCPEDNIGIELRFLAHLVGVALGSRVGDASFSESCRQQLCFLDEHVLTWTSAFAGLLRESTDEEFFAGYSSLVARLPRWHRDLLTPVLEGA